MGKPERFKVSQVVIPADVADDQPVLDVVWEKLQAKAASRIPAERPGWAICPDLGEDRYTQFYRFVGKGGDRILLPCDREDADLVEFTLGVWAEQTAA